MKFYKVRYYVEAGSSGGFGFATNRADAEKLAADHAKNHPTEQPCEIEVIEVRPTKAGILSALRVHAYHPDNG